MMGAAIDELEDQMIEDFQTLTDGIDNLVLTGVEEQKQAVDDAVANIAAIKDAAQGEIDDLRDQLNRDIKELVFRINHAQSTEGGENATPQLLQEIADKKATYQTLIDEKTQELEDAIAAEKMAAQEKIDALREELDAAIEEAKEQCEEVIADAMDVMEEVLEDAKEATDEMMAPMVEGLEDLFTEAEDAWHDRYHYELLNAKFQQDSYYRFSLLCLVHAKHDGVADALNDLRNSITEGMNEVEQEAQEERQDEREDLTDFANTKREELAMQIEADLEDLELIIDELENALNDGIDDIVDDFNEGVIEDQDQMKTILKEIYNFNNHDVDAAENFNGVNAYAIDTHRAFITKLKYYTDHQFLHLDTKLQNSVDMYNAVITGDVEGEDIMVDEMENAVDNALQQAMDAAQQLLDDAIAELQDGADTEIAMLDDAKNAAEAALESKICAAQKELVAINGIMNALEEVAEPDEVIENPNLITPEAGFGLAPSSFLANGTNFLTGIDELDLITADGGNVEWDFTLAQVADKPEEVPVEEPEEDPLENDADGNGVVEGGEVDPMDVMEEERDDKIQEVVDCIDAAILEIDDALVAENEEAQTRTDDLINALTDMTNGLRDGLMGMMDVNEDNLDAVEEVNTDDLEALIDERVEQCEVAITDKINKVNGWLDDKLEWADSIPDEEWRIDVVDELNAVKDYLNEKFNQKLQQALDDAQAARDALANGMGDA
jgi:hypothetical protein